MSKLERLNTRVAKLLTDAVQEVLDVVKETVLEYQEETARTQRENQSLKRRLEALEDSITRESKCDVSTCSPKPEGQEGAQIEEQDSERHSEQKLIISHQPEDVVENILNQQDSFSIIESQYDLVETTECSKTQPDAVQHIYNNTMIDHTSHSTSSAMPSNRICGSNSSNSLRINLATIKTEEPSDFTPSELRSSDESHSPQVCAEPYRPFFVHTNNGLLRRNGFAKMNKVAFDGRKLRMDHFRRDDSYLCVVCGKTFGKVGNLRIHQRCHTGEKPYGCVLCGRRFRQSGDLTKHKRVHTGEKPYNCNQCGKSFNRGENLKRHQKLHTGGSLQSQQDSREQRQ